MLSSRPTLRVAVAALAVVAAARLARAEAASGATDDGQTFLYRARPGDYPSVVAQTFGIPDEAFPEFLAENGIRDPNRVSAGFVYRIPNRAARAASARVRELETERGRLTVARDQAEARAGALGADLATARAAAERATTRLAGLERRVALWPLLQIGLVLAIAAAAFAVWVASAAARRERGVERHARALELELDEKRRTALTERQESGKRILDLEARVRTLEAQAIPRRGPRPREFAG